MRASDTSVAPAWEHESLVVNADRITRQTDTESPPALPNWPFSGSWTIARRSIGEREKWLKAVKPNYFQSAIIT